jgi:Domain of unknown function (DU1801)
MSIKEQIETCIAAHPEPKRGEMEQLHALLHGVLPQGKLWFDDGKNTLGKVVCNPTIGYGEQMLQYAGGKTKAFFQIGLCATQTGISVYVLGLKDKKYLADTYSKRLGKASITGYCIKFKHLKDIDLDVLVEAVKYGVKETI